jgi:hypothetical protein
MEASGTPRRGEVGKQTFEQVQTLIKSGMKATEAFAHVARDSGRSAATVATAYYRAARTIPDSGVKHRPRSGKASGAARTPRRAAAPSTNSTRARTTQALVRDLLEAANALARHSEQLDSELSNTRRDSAAWAEIQRLVQSR